MEKLTVDWFPYPLLYHGGSNEMNLIHICLDTKRDFAIVIGANVSEQKANIGILQSQLRKNCIQK